MSSRSRCVTHKGSQKVARVRVRYVNVRGVRRAYKTSPTLSYYEFNSFNINLIVSMFFTNKINYIPIMFVLWMDNIESDYITLSLKTRGKLKVVYRMNVWVRSVWMGMCQSISIVDAANDRRVKCLHFIYSIYLHIKLDAPREISIT